MKKTDQRPVRRRCCCVCQTSRHAKYCCVWVAWSAFACLLRLLDALFLSLPSHLVYAVVSVDWLAVVSGVLWGAFLSFAVFLPTERVFLDASRPLCLSYLSLVAWVCGHLLFALLCVLGLFDAMYELERWPRVWAPQLPPRDGMYFGLLIGLMFAFPVLTTEHANDPSVLDGVRFCQTDKNMHISLLFGAFLFAGAVDGLLGPRLPNRHGGYQLKQQQQRHTHNGFTQDDMDYDAADREIDALSRVLDKDHEQREAEEQDDDDDEQDDLYAPSLDGSPKLRAGNTASHARL